jgi:hypothetical protein
MALTDAIIEADIDKIFTDLAGTGIVETVSRIPAGTTTPPVPSELFSVIRAKKKTSQELQNSGYSRRYRFTVYAKRDAVGETEEGDILVMADAVRLRVVRLEEGPARIVVALDLGSEFEDRED